MCFSPYLSDVLFAHGQEKIGKAPKEKDFVRSSFGRLFYSLSELAPGVNNSRLDSTGGSIDLGSVRCRF